jgi:hypothetical protein
VSEPEEYMIGFWAHGEYHEIAIDLECLAIALNLPRAEEAERD